jgi:hypothetical protein
VYPPILLDNQTLNDIFIRKGKPVNGRYFLKKYSSMKILYKNEALFILSHHTRELVPDNNVPVSRRPKPKFNPCQ